MKYNLHKPERCVLHNHNQQPYIANYNIRTKKALELITLLIKQVCAVKTSTIFFFWGLVAIKVVIKFEKDPRMVVYVR